MIWTINKTYKLIDMWKTDKMHNELMRKKLVFERVLELSTRSENSTFFN